MKQFITLLFAFAAVTLCGVFFYNIWSNLLFLYLAALCAGIAYILPKVEITRPRQEKKKR